MSACLRVTSALLSTVVLCALLIVHPAHAVPEEAPPSSPKVVSFHDGDLELRGVLYMPEGDGPFPTFLFNHGSAPGRLNDHSIEAIGPLFRSRGWVFFAPYRRGQGLSSGAGPYIGKEIADAQGKNARHVLPVLVLTTVLILWAVVVATRRRPFWLRATSVGVLVVAGSGAGYVSHFHAGATAMLMALETDHLDDHQAARDWLEEQSFVDQGRIATGGNSFGGIITVLGAERARYCAAVNAAGGSESWRSAPGLRARMRQAVLHSQSPIFFFQASNDYDLTPSQALAGIMSNAGLPNRLKIYPAFGDSAADGHSFAWRGSAVWAGDVFEFLDEHCVLENRASARSKESW